MDHRLWFPQFFSHCSRSPPELFLFEETQKVNFWNWYYIISHRCSRVFFRRFFSSFYIKLELIWVRPYNLLTPYIQKHLQIPYLLTALQNHLHTSKACIFTSFLYEQVRQCTLTQFKDKVDYPLSTAAVVTCVGVWVVTEWSGLSNSQVITNSWQLSRLSVRP